MIKVYTSPSCTSCRKARAWLQANQLEFEEKNIFAEPLTESEIKKILAATEGGVQDIISTRSKIYEKLGIDFNELTLKQMIVLFKEYPSLLRRPILIDEKRILIGFNEDEIRSFVPREIRCVARNLIYLQNNNILNSWGGSLRGSESLWISALCNKSEGETMVRTPSIALSIC